MQDGESTSSRGGPLVQNAPWSLLSARALSIHMGWVKRSELDSRSIHCSYMGWRFGVYSRTRWHRVPGRGAKVAGTVVLGCVAMGEEGRGWVVVGGLEPAECGNFDLGKVGVGWKESLTLVSEVRKVVCAYPLSVWAVFSWS